MLVKFSIFFFVRIFQCNSINSHKYCTKLIGKDHSYEVFARDDAFDFSEEFRRKVPGDAMFTNINGFGDPKYNAKVVKEYISNKLGLYTECMQKSLYSATQRYIGCDDDRTIYNFSYVMPKIISTPIANIFIGEVSNIEFFFFKKKKNIYKFSLFF